MLQYCDLCHRRLPNQLVVIYAVLCPVALWFAGATPSVWLQHGIVAVMGFSFFLVFFIMGGMGGGDVKLGAAVLGWAGLQSLSVTLLVIAITGLLLAVLGVIADRLAVPESVKGKGAVFRAWQSVLYALSVKRGVPYGVALAAGGMFALPAYWP